MTAGFIDGFDHYAAADIFSKWTGQFSGAPNVAILPTYARGTGQGITMTAAALNRGIYKTVWPAGSATVTMGAAVWLTAYPATTGILFAFVDGSGEQCSIRGDGGGKLTVNQGANIRATSTNLITLNAWHFIEFKATVSSSGTAELRVDGTSTGWVPSTGSLDLTGTANNYATGAALAQCTAAANSAYFDDVYLTDDGTFWGDGKAACLRPQAAGNYAQWTSNGGPNFANVNDDPYYDGDTSFNQSSTANQIDSFVMDDVPAATGAIPFVQISGWLKKDVGAARTFCFHQRDSGTDSEWATQNVGTSYAMFTEGRFVNPNGGGAWTIAVVNGLEIGYKLKS